MADARLPQAEWMQREDLQQLVRILDPDGLGLVRYVGGMVRDTLLGHRVRDVDMASRILPDQARALLKKGGIRSVPTGMDHGTITAILPNGPVEITTLRRDVSTDGRRATIAFSDDWREDAARRDFTINALYADPLTYEIHDYFNGLEDLRNGLVRFIGNAGQRIAEDHLRILRYFRFFARFGDEAPDPEAIAACTAGAASLKALSRERIAKELLLLLALPDSRHTLALMDDCAIWPHCLPEILPPDKRLLDRLISNEHAAGCTAHAITRLAALLGEDADIAVSAAKRLKMSRKIQKTLYFLCSGPGQLEQAPGADIQTKSRALAWNRDSETVRQLALLWCEADQMRAVFAALNGWHAAPFIITGRDIMACGIEPGPEVARVLSELRQQWMAEGFPDADRQKEILAEFSQRS